MLRLVFAVLAVMAASWAVGVRLLGPFAISLAGVRVSSSDAFRPLIVALVAAGIYLGVSGHTRVLRDVHLLRRRATPTSLALLLVAVVLIVTVARNSWTAGGPDSYSYVSQADLWLRGNLKVPVPLADRAPWPRALTTFTPFGYRALPNETAIAPATGPGLPLMMAAFKLVFGHAAGFLVAPLTAALLVWMTFLMGTRVASPAVGLGGAWLVATSPTFLMMGKSQMSDVPAAAFWSVATYYALGSSARSACAAGLAASMAILIRPNLVPLAAVLFVWLIAERWRAARADRREASSDVSIAGGPPPSTDGGAAIGSRLFGPAVLFAIATLPGCLAIAAINAWLYGSPLSSGYGELQDLFSIANVPIALGTYAKWFAETQTPLAAAGVILLAAAPRRVWPDAAGRARARVLAGMAATVWALYSIYMPFGAWWFLRFLLPSWPALFIGTAALVVWLCQRGVSRTGTVATLVLLALGVFGLVVTWQRNVFPQDEGERRYATIATLVQEHTDPQAVILASIHAGPTRYYSGRATMRFDLLDEAWLDRTVDWLRLHDRHPYVLVEDWELPGFTARFKGMNRLADLGAAPVLAYRAYAIPGTVYLFDPLRRDGPTVTPAPIPNPLPRCVEPGPEAPM